MKDRLQNWLTFFNFLIHSLFSHQYFQVLEYADAPAHIFPQNSHDTAFARQEVLHVLFSCERSYVFEILQNSHKNSVKFSLV
jgi:hypothetical protein